MQTIDPQFPVTLKAGTVHRLIALIRASNIPCSEGVLMIEHLMQEVASQCAPKPSEESPA